MAALTPASREIYRRASIGLATVRQAAQRQIARISGLQFIEHSTLRCEAIDNGGGLHMIPGSILGLVPIVLGLFAAQPGIVEQSVTRLVVQDEIILRVPIQPRPFMPQIDWEERKGPKCIPVAGLQRALMSGPQQVDFVLANRARVRAELDEDCP